jgi:hypothetical protein
MLLSDELKNFQIWPVQKVGQQKSPLLPTQRMKVDTTWPTFS